VYIRAIEIGVKRIHGWHYLMSLAGWVVVWVWPWVNQQDLRWYNVGIASCHTSLVKVLATSIDTRCRPRPTLEFYHAKSINMIAEPTSKAHVSWKLVRGFNSTLSYLMFDDVTYIGPVNYSWVTGSISHPKVCGTNLETLCPPTPLCVIWVTIGWKIAVRKC